MTRTTPELEAPLQASATARGLLGPLRMTKREAVPMHGESSMEWGFEPESLQPQSRDLITRLPQPRELKWILFSLEFSNYMLEIFIIFIQALQLQTVLCLAFGRILFQIIILNSSHLIFSYKYYVSGLV
ncbi:hypothetical protein AVEN_186042-1 [Araneus ventricosus]|uniref:Uncharacterized protein n=1 Tax=Araneus ventricosus TaxID=182803 RepID=A0A4Y2G6F2_ARAVE|nr:hypothetical protein AVEN_18759-1 [Araneus ventricosus]GBN69791.1 hypothetical protein AVEN_186042-1 [Araneus ventricosus]